MATCGGEDVVDDANEIKEAIVKSASVQTSVLKVDDADCPNGGMKFEILIDGVVQAEEAQYVCHGAADACANNVAPAIEANLESMLVYEAGKPYSLTVTANKAGLDYRFVAPYMRIEKNGAEEDLEGTYVTQYSVTPELDASATVIISAPVITAADNCESALAEISLVVGAEEIAGAGVRIPAGNFNSSMPNASNPVSIGEFVMSKAPMTVAQFAQCVEAGACSADNYDTASDHELCNYNHWGNRLDHPMNCVVWSGAREYCEWIGGRLPTEDEWEYAATHDGTSARQTTYPWGDKAPTHCREANYRVNDNSVETKYCDGTTEVKDDVGTSAVGTYSPQGDSPLGLQDMSGNVWEWTSSSKYARDMDVYIFKGGSWLSASSDLRVTTYRDWDNPTLKNLYIGLRCVFSSK